MSTMSQSIVLMISEGCCWMDYVWTGSTKDYISMKCMGTSFIARPVRGCSEVVLQSIYMQSLNHDCHPCTMLSSRNSDESLCVYTIW